MIHQMLMALYENDARGSVVLNDESRKAVQELERRKLINDLWYHLEDSGSETLDVVSFELTAACSLMLVRVEGLVAGELG